MKKLPKDNTNNKSSSCRAESKLAGSEERTQILIDSFKDIAVEIDADLRLTHVGQTISSLNGYAPEEIIGCTAKDFLTIASQETFNVNLADAFARQESSGERAVISVDEYETLHKDGSSVWYEVTSTVIFSIDNKLKQIFGIFRDISGRKKTEKELELSFSLIKAAFDSTADGLLVVSNDGKVLQYNRKFIDLWQIPANIMESNNDSQLLSFAAKQLKHPGQFLDRVKELYMQPDAVSFDELEFIDGTIFERYSQPQKIREKSVGRVWSFRDTTERRNSERALQNANVLLKKTISCLNEAVFIVATHSHRIQEVNTSAEKMFGYTRGELIGAHTSILHLNEDMYKWFGTEMIRSYGEKGHFQTTYRMKRKDGTVFSSEHYVAPIITDDGSYQSHACVVRDISERIQTEVSLAKAFSALEERKSFVESIITNLQSGIIVTDLDFRITMVNPYVQDICCIPAEKIVGMSLHDLCPEIAAQVASRVNANEILVNFRGTELTVGFTRLDMKNAEKKAVGHIINFRDLTEIVRIRNKIHQKERLSAMGEVVAAVAHEMRNPLFGMTSVGQILDMELTLSPPHQQLMDSFMKESRRLNNLVQELLDGTREVRLRKKTFNISHIIDASLQACKMNLQEKNIELHWDRPDSELMIMADPEKLEQVIVNLIHNAIEASNPGKGIDLVLESDSESISIILIDSGSGIPQNVLPNIFDVFFTTKKAGTGMGLSISKNIAEAHGGTLTAQNIAGRGAKFTLKLPLDNNKP